MSLASGIKLMFLVIKHWNGMEGGGNYMEHKGGFLQPTAVFSSMTPHTDVRNRKADGVLPCVGISCYLSTVIMNWIFQDPEVFSKYQWSTAATLAQLLLAWRQSRRDRRLSGIRALFVFSKMWYFGDEPLICQYHSVLWKWMTQQFFMCPTVIDRLWSAFGRNVAPVAPCLRGTRASGMIFPKLIQLWQK